MRTTGGGPKPNKQKALIELQALTSYLPPLWPGQVPGAIFPLPTHYPSSPAGPHHPCGLLFLFLLLRQQEAALHLR